VAAIAEGGAGGVIEHIDKDGQKYSGDNRQHFIKLGTKMKVDADPLQKLPNLAFLCGIFH
jgi:hypothetical protein